MIKRLNQPNKTRQKPLPADSLTHAGAIYPVKQASNRRKVNKNEGRLPTLAHICILSSMISQRNEILTAKKIGHRLISTLPM